MRPVAIAVIALLSPSLGAAAGSSPAGVQHFSQQLTERCAAQGGKASTGGRFLQKADLNGDKINDWIMDESEFVCAGGPAVDRTLPSQVMIFVGDAKGDAQPVFQQTAFGVRMERGVLWMAVNGPQCGRDVDRTQFCDRPIVWNKTAGRPEFAPTAQARTPSRIRG